MSDRVVVDPGSFPSAAAELIGRYLGEVNGTGGRISLGLAGGNTVAPVYEHLAELPSVSQSWNAVNFYFGDERAVPPTHRDSNYRLAWETLLSRIPDATARIHRMEAERHDLDEAARDYDALLPASVDLLLLGMGADGHIASLFPGSPALEEHARRVVPTFGGIPRVPRLTITPRVVAEARSIIVMVSGSSKQAAVVRALEGPADTHGCPAQLVRRATWILDHAAAEGLRPLSGDPDWRVAKPDWRP
jgi:6-phosphogluconolactonase